MKTNESTTHNFWSIWAAAYDRIERGGNIHHSMWANIGNSEKSLLPDRLLNQTEHMPSTARSVRIKCIASSASDVELTLIKKRI